MNEQFQASPDPSKYPHFHLRTEEDGTVSREAIDYRKEEEGEAIFEFNGQKFYLEEDVIYSVYPLVERGTGFITKEGVRSTGQTRIDIEEQGFGDICPFEGLYDINRAVPMDGDILTVIISPSTFPDIDRWNEEH